MNTVAVMLKWIERESTVQIADRLGMDRGTISRQINGHLGISSKHISAYLEACPDDLRPDLLGAWLLDIIPPQFHDELLNPNGLPKLEVQSFHPNPDAKARARGEWLLGAAATDADLRKILFQVTDWMGYEEPISPTRIKSIPTNTNES